MVGVSSQIDYEHKETTAQIMARALIFERREEDELMEVINEFPSRPHMRQNPDSPAVSQWPPAPQNFLAETLKHRGSGNYSRDRGGPYLPQGVGTNWLACQSTDVALNPPDTQIAVGPTQIIMVINGRIRLFDKAGNLGFLDSTLDSFFAAERGPNFVGDSRIRYDSMASRWVITTQTFTSPNRIIFCYSDGPTITPTTVWTKSFFVQDAVGTTPNVDAGRLADYQTLGVDEDGIIIGANMFLSGYQGCSLWVLRKSDVYDGAPFTVTPFRAITTASSAGIYTPQPVSNDQTGINTSYVIGVDNVSFGKLVMRRLTNVDSFAPVLSAAVDITVPTTTLPQGVSVLGSSGPASSVDERLIEAEIRLNRLNGTRTLWTCHQIEVDATGAANAAGNRNGTRWYQLGSLDTNPPNLVQSGTLWDPAATNPNSYWMSGINMNGQGHMAIMPTAAGLARRLEIVAAGRLRGDALGTTQAPTNVVTTTTNYPGVTRWGDYAAVRVDPQDDQTMWGAQEYCSGTGVWGIRIAKLMAPPPATPITVTPSSIPENATTSVVVSCNLAAGELFDTQAGMNRLAASIGGGGVTVNSVTWNSISQVTLSLTAAPGSVGSKTVTVTNPDGQSVTSGSILTVSPATPAPTLTSISPSTIPVGSAAFTLTATGSNFTSSSFIQWNGTNRTTTFVNSTTLTATISAADVSLGGVYPVTVFTPAPGGGTSVALNFSVTNPAPTLTAISPSNTLVGGPSFTVTCTGTNFNSQSRVRRNGAVRTTTFVNSTTVTATLTAADIASPGTFLLEVNNPTPGGGTSASQTFTVNNPAPTLTTISPTSALVGSGSITLTCTGTNFRSNSVIRWNGSNLSTTFVNSTTLTTNISSTLLETAGLVPVTVFTPTPGGGTSSAVNFTVNNPAPTVTSISPTTQAAGGAGFTLFVNGTNFNTQSIVRFNGVNRVTTFNSSTTLTATILASDIAAGGIFPITVFNPAPGGGTSGPVSLTVTNPLPVLSSISPTLVAVGGPNFTLTCNGSSFVPTSVVQINGANRTTTFVSSTLITATILASDIATAGTRLIRVFNPVPGGGLSAASLTLSVSARVFSGTVNLVGYSDPTGVPITLRFRPVGGASGSEVLTTTVNLSPTSTFTLSTNLPPANYDIYADGSIWLQRRRANVNATGLVISGLTWNLPAGDIDGDGAITPSDYGIWAANNGSFVTPGEFGDLDGDGAVTPSDYGIWAENNGLFDDD